MFASTNFNGDISKWDVSQVTDMNNMFWRTTSFNSDISKWDVSKVTDMSQMFASTNFNADISKWDVSRVANMTAMFEKAKSFQADISKWDVSGVARMNNMFHSAKSFNGDISKWDVSSVTNMNHMFMSATSFKRQLCRNEWVYSKATKKDMFVGSPGSISITVCPTSLPQRWLARWRTVSAPIIPSLTTPSVASAIMICPNCDTFKRSGRASCCAPGGAWHNN